MSVSCLMQSIPGPLRHGHIRSVRVCQNMWDVNSDGKTCTRNSGKYPVCHYCYDNSDKNSDSDGDSRNRDKEKPTTHAAGSCNVMSNLTLRNDAYYTLTVDASTKHGYNHALEAPTLAILPQSEITPSE